MRLQWRLGHQPVLPRSLSRLLWSSQLSYLQRSLSCCQQYDSRVFTFGPELMSKRLLCQWTTVALSTQVCCPVFMKVCGALRLNFGGVQVGSARPFYDVMWSGRHSLCWRYWTNVERLSTQEPVLDCWSLFRPLRSTSGLLSHFQVQNVNGRLQVRWLRETSLPPDTFDRVTLKTQHRS